MKNLYYIILILFTITSSSATEDQSLVGTPTDDGRSTAGFSDACSTRSVELRSLLQPAEYKLPQDLRQFNNEQLLTEFVKVAEAYTNLLEYVKARNAQIEDFLGEVNRILPDDSEQNSLLIDKLIKIRQKFTKIALMLKDAKKDKKLTVTENKALQSSVATLTARVSELEETATQAERLERTNRDQMDAFTNLEKRLDEKEAKITSLNEAMREVNAVTISLREELESATARAARITNGDVERELASSKLLVDRLTRERDAAIAKADAAIAKADAATANAAAEQARADNEASEKNRLQAALTAAEAKQRNAAAGGKEGSPLLVNGGDYTRLDESVGNSSRRPTKKEDGCPCVVM